MSSLKRQWDDAMSKFHPSRGYAQTRVVKYIRNLFSLNKPTAATWDDWEKWRETAQKEHPIVYWVTEKLPRKLEWVTNHTVGYFEDASTYIINRKCQTHCLPSRLKVGRNHSFETRVLYSLFDTFNDNIERGEAYFETTAYNESTGTREDQVPWYQDIFFKPWRSPELGRQHLKTMLAEDMDAEAKYTTFEKIVLYSWWNEIYPNRGDAIVESGLAQFLDEMRDKYDTKNLFSFRKILNQEEQAKYDLFNRRVDEIEKQWEKEEDEMLHRLISLRRKLWN